MQIITSIWNSISFDIFHIRCFFPVMCRILENVNVVEREDDDDYDDSCAVM